jgi:DNA polymerase
MEHETALEELRREAAGCRACPLYRDATQTVFGEGPAPSAMMLVGEQPGDQEDMAGRPFVGPAGQVLDRALMAAGIDRGAVYVTNAVKHFKFTQRGKRRLHQKPDSSEVAACHSWLLAEIETVAPDRIVALGATAAQALLGRPVTIGRERGRLRPFGSGRRILVTVHPSYILRIPDERAKEAEYSRLVADLRAAATDDAHEPDPPKEGQLGLF